MTYLFRNEAQTALLRYMYASNGWAALLSVVTADDDHNEAKSSKNGGGGGGCIVTNHQMFVAEKSVDNTLRLRDMLYE